jgi:hypothetical protein
MQHDAPDEDSGILAKLNGSDVARAVILCGERFGLDAEAGRSATVLVGTEYHGPTRVRCELKQAKRHRQVWRFWCAVYAEPR